MRLSTKHVQFGLVAAGVFALVAIDLYAGNKDRDVDVPLDSREQQQNENVSSNLERRAAEGELEMYNNNMLDASLAAHGEELPAAAYNPQLPGEDDQPKPRSIARRDEDLDFVAANNIDDPILEVQDQQVHPGAVDRYQVKPDAPKPAYMLPPPKKQPPPRPVQPVQPVQSVAPPIVPQQQTKQPRASQTTPAQQKPEAQPRPIKPDFLEQAAKVNEAASTETVTKIDYNPSASANAGGLRGGADAGRDQARNAAYHPHLDQNQGKISEMEVVEGEVQRRRARATWLTGGLFGGLFVVYKAASMGYLLF